jgi:hypothetical protein
MRKNPAADKDRGSEVRETPSFQSTPLVEGISVRGVGNRTRALPSRSRESRAEGKCEMNGEKLSLPRTCQKEKPRSEATRLRGLFEHPSSSPRGAPGLQVGGHKRPPLPAEMSAFEVSHRKRRLSARSPTH